MHTYSLIAPAKINLYLEIVGDRPDGYHQLVMILHSIELADKIEFHPNGTDKIRLYCHHPEVPTDESNLALKAAYLMRREFPQLASNYGGFDITIDKHIPVAAGLAGGSTNAAAVLVGINLMWNMGLTQPELQILAAKLGSDIPFCIAGGCAIATGRGEELEPITDINNLWVVLAKYKSLSISTPWAYQTYRQNFADSYLRDPIAIESRTHKIHAGGLVKAIAHQDGVNIGKLLHNDLEKVVLPAYPQVASLRESLQGAGGLGTMMSGSGSTVFTLCESQLQAEEIVSVVRAKIPNPDLEFWVTRLSNSGIHVGNRE